MFISHKTTVNQMISFLAGVHPTLYMLHTCMYTDMTLSCTRTQTWNISVRVLCLFYYHVYVYIVYVCMWDIKYEKGSS